MMGKGGDDAWNDKDLDIMADAYGIMADDEYII